MVEERTCKVYSSFLSSELNNRHVPARLINTLDLGLEYEHMFVLVPSNDTGYFLADLTFSQFNRKVEHLNKLLVYGYQLIDDINFNSYLNIVDNGNFNIKISADDAFYNFESFSNDSAKHK